MKSVKDNEALYREFKKICLINGIENSKQYLQRYKEIPGLPCHPERKFSKFWEGFPKALNKPDFYTYSELKKKIRKYGLKSMREYKSLLRQLKDPRIPMDPETVYEDEWENCFRFLGKTEPFSLNYIGADYQTWKELLEDFADEVDGGISKKGYICRFIRLFIQKHDKSPTPQAFLTKEKHNLKPLKRELERLESKNMKSLIVKYTNEFLDHILETELTLEDEDTGEVVRVLNARNPLNLMVNKYRNKKKDTLGESNKPRLQHHFIKKAEKWIIPEEATCFRDLKHLQQFDADWKEVSVKVIDRNDPDCVYKKIKNKYNLWIPTCWIATYTLTCAPLRGIQIAYNDSGEADSIIPEVNANGEVYWIENNSRLAGKTENQGFVSLIEDGQLGMFNTTNKTSREQTSYFVPWIPEGLAPLLIKLRKWQSKYNPIRKVTPWSVLTRTNFNKRQLRDKGENCFLFRDFGAVEPKAVSGMLQSRLAVALYNIQPLGMKLATCHGLGDCLSHYKSKYTPHSMRVSLITAFVMDMGLPVEVVMKIVGHSSIVMTIYYCRATNAEIREKMEFYEKLKLKSEAEAIQKTIEANRIEEIKNKLFSSNKELIDNLTNQVPAGNFVFRDYGICPYAATACETGGEVIQKSKIRSPTPNGYLGIQNCLRCRHFITGPSYVGGLIALANEIIYAVTLQLKKCDETQSKVDSIEKKINELEELEYKANINGEFFNPKDTESLSKDLRRMQAQYVSSAKKLDMYLCDVQAANKLIKLSLQAASDKKESKASLIRSNESDLVVEYEESHKIQLLQEICENAMLYEFSSPESAVLPRTQLIDRMNIRNGIKPFLFELTESQQLVVGNEILKLMKSRLESWSKVGELIDCNVLFSDLEGGEKISPAEIEFVAKKTLEISSTTGHKYGT